MFTPSRDQARELFFATWEKYLAKQALEGLEMTVLDVVLLHPEYHALLGDRERNLDRDYSPESGELNPFLHLSLHLAVSEQLSINQPTGISDLFESLATHMKDRHAALHVVLECLGETLWQATRLGSAPDQDAYLACMRARLGNDSN